MLTEEDARFLMMILTKVQVSAGDPDFEEFAARVISCKKTLTEVLDDHS